jgi:hypothetical protein
VAGKFARWAAWWLHLPCETVFRLQTFKAMRHKTTGRPIQCFKFLLANHQLQLNILQPHANSPIAPPASPYFK